MNKQLLQDINPTNGEKYSPYLHAYLQKNRSDYTELSVFKGKDDVLWLGYVYDGDLIGAQLNRVLGFGRACVTACYAGLPVKEVPEFWNEYVAIGRCAIDKEHAISFRNADGRYTRDGDSRTCNWCGHKQTLRRWQETTERTAWELAAK